MIVSIKNRGQVITITFDSNRKGNMLFLERMIIKIATPFYKTKNRGQVITDNFFDGKYLMIGYSYHLTP